MNSPVPVNNYISSPLQNFKIPKKAFASNQNFSDNNNQALPNTVPPPITDNANNNANIPRASTSNSNNVPKNTSKIKESNKSRLPYQKSVISKPANQIISHRHLSTQALT